MTIKSFIAQGALALTICLVSASTTSLTVAQGGKPNASPEEQSMYAAVMKAPDTAAKLKAAEALIKKYPKSPGRPRLARSMAGAIDGEKDAAQKVTLGQEYQGAFKEPSEQQMITPVLIDALAGAKRLDDAFSTGAGFPASNSDALVVLVQLMG